MKSRCRTVSGPITSLSVNLLDHTHDVYELLASIREYVTEGTLIVVTTSNPLWAPVLRLGQSPRPALPESPRNFITNRDIASILNVLGFDVVEAGLALPVPERVPVLAPVLNARCRTCPLLRYLSSTQYLAARPRIAREQLSVSVVVPCHNEEGNVGACARRVPDMGAGNGDHLRRRWLQRRHTSGGARGDGAGSACPARCVRHQSR